MVVVGQGLEEKGGGDPRERWPGVRVLSARSLGWLYCPRRSASIPRAGPRADTVKAAGRIPSFSQGVLPHRPSSAVASPGLACFAPTVLDLDHRPACRPLCGGPTLPHPGGPGAPRRCATRHSALGGAPWAALGPRSGHPPRLSAASPYTLLVRVSDLPTGKGQIPKESSGLQLETASRPR